MNPSLIFFAAMLVLAWLFLINPQRRRRREQLQMIAALQSGDEVITTGGLYGRVSEVGASHITLEIAPATQVRVAKSAVAGLAEQEPPETELEPR